jgi:hypothetical protein
VLKCKKGPAIQTALDLKCWGCRYELAQAGPASHLTVLNLSRNLLRACQPRLAA